MDYKQAIEYMESLKNLGSVMGLEGIRELMARLGNVQNELKFIHVAGTNGKGSVCALLNSILCEAGLKTGVYTSPSVFTYLEKYRIGRRTLTREAFAKALEKVAAAADAMEVHPTPFEVETATAFVAFKEAGCDVVILECGLGGRDDATNIADTAILNIFTSISYDHTGILGKTLPDIAGNKAGIMRKNVPCIAGKMDEEALGKLRSMATKMGCSLENLDEICSISVKKQDICGTIADYLISGESYEDIRLPLAGGVQTENCALAIRASQIVSSAIFKKNISPACVRRGISKVSHPGRFEIIAENPLTIIDGAHNPDAALRLRENIRSLIFEDRKLKKGKLILIMGVFADKDYEKVAEIVTPLAAQVITLNTPDNSRALPSIELAKCVQEYNRNVSSASSVQEAYEMALLFAGKNDTILAFGSLSYLGLLKKIVRSGQDAVKTI